MTNKTRHLTSLLTLVLFVVLFPSAVRDQTLHSTHQNQDYALDLPSAGWRAITVAGVVKDSTEFRYGGQSSVRMRVRRELVDAGVLPSDLVRRQQSSDRVNLRGYVKGKSENFEGQLNGVKYPYGFISAGKSKARLTYYLQADPRTVYRLEFSGPPKELLGIEDQIDLIARSFRVR